MTAVDICFYHAGCVDGLGAAYAIWKLFPDAKFIPVSYSDPVPDVAIGQTVVLVDFTWPRAVLEELASRQTSVLVLDHHKTAAADLAGVARAPDNWDLYCRSLQPPDDLSCVFDMDRSGAGIAWDYFHPGDPMPLALQLIQDRDLWRFKYGELSKHFNAFIRSWPLSFEFLDGFCMVESAVNRAVTEGEAICRYQLQITQSAIEDSLRTMVIAGHRVPVINVPRSLVSEALNIVAVGHPFAAGYVDSADGRWFSLRSSPEGVDVSVVAKALGALFGTNGGGHKGAAGFTAPRGWEGDVVQ